MVKWAVVIPARFASTRFPGKPLAMLTGAGGIAKPLIQRSWEAACRVPGSPAVVVATDDDRIAKVARDFGAQVIMTPAACANGTERCAAALSALGDVEVVVNLQGDAPLTPCAAVTALMTELDCDPDVLVVTPAVRATAATHRRLLVDQQAGRVGGTTLVRSANGDALYFSKAVIPHVSPDRVGERDLPIYLHLGVYAYRRAALEAYASRAAGEVEQLEGLEQLRFLDAGIAVRTVEIDTDGDVWELNNPHDIVPIEAALAARGIA